MVSGFFVGLLIETPDKVLEDVAHGDIWYSVWMFRGLGVQINSGDLLDHFKKSISFFQ
jgi:hypothetical protein